jgi:hypothetical protein
MFSPPEISYNTVKMQRVAKHISFIGIVAMVAVIGYATIVGDLASDGGELLRNPWGVVSLVDLYVGFILFSLWITYREASRLHAAAWIIAMMVFGFLAGALYAFVNLMRSQDMPSFFLGHHADKD